MLTFGEICMINVKDSKVSFSRVERLNKYVTYPVNKAKSDGIHRLNKNNLGNFEMK